MGTSDDHPSKRCCLDRDFISNLPRNVIDQILEFMPIQDAVKTSILAKNWRYNWATISKIMFNSAFINYLHKRSVYGPEICGIITNFLLLHQGDIQCFVLNLFYLDIARIGDVDKWILVLSRKGVKELTIQLPPIYKLPSHFYSCLNLTRLDLWGCIFNPPPLFGGFPNLLHTMIFEVTLEEYSFRRFTTRCPLLHTMRIETCFGSYQLIIYSQSLQYLRLDCYNLKSLCMDVENLKTLHLDGDFLIGNSSGSQERNMAKLFHGLLKIEELTFRGETFKLVAAGSSLRRLPTPLNFLKMVGVYALDFEDPAQISCLLCLIRSSPNMQELHIETIRDGRNMKPVFNFGGEEDIISSLRTVTFNLIGCWNIQLDFIKHLLARTPSLKQMDIYHFETGDEEVDEQNKELLISSRASPEAKINFPKSDFPDW